MIAIKPDDIFKAEPLKANHKPQKVKIINMLKRSAAVGVTMMCNKLGK